MPAEEEPQCGTVESGLERRTGPLQSGAGPWTEAAGRRGGAGENERASDHRVLMTALYN